MAGIDTEKKPPKKFILVRPVTPSDHPAETAKVRARPRSRPAPRRRDGTWNTTRLHHRSSPEQRESSEFHCPTDSEQA